MRCGWPWDWLVDLLEVLPRAADASRPMQPRGRGSRFGGRRVAVVCYPPDDLDGLGQSVILWTLIGYLVGAVPMGVLLARLRGIDLRTVGSGNIGATNAARALGTKLGLLVFVLDAAKAAFPVWLASHALAAAPAAQWGLASVAMAAVLGHIFPVYLRFRGGKGVACALGVFLALDPIVALAAMILYVQGIWLTRISAVGSLTAVTAMALTVVIADKPVAYQVLAIAVGLVIWMRHTSNIKQLTADAKARKIARHAATSSET
jgi:acyl phosphate:glycerol-3-phosphate acyltransferase